MMAKSQLLILLCFMVLGSVNGTQVGCFDFPTLSPGLVVTARENTAVGFPFRLHDGAPACSGLTKSIYISRPSETSATEFCVLRVTGGGECITVFNQQNCRCSSEGDSEGAAFTFTKNITPDDSGHWLWKIGDEPSQWAHVVLDVLSADGKSRYTPRGGFGLDFPKNTISPEAHEEMADLSTTAMTTDDFVEGQLPGGWFLFGGVFVGVNILTIIVVATVVYVLRGRRERRRRSTSGMLPPTAERKKDKGKKEQRHQDTPGHDPTPSFMGLENTHQSCYYENTEAVSFAVTNGGYEIPKLV